MGLQECCKYQLHRRWLGGLWGSRSRSATRLDSIIRFQLVVRSTQCEIKNNCELDPSRMKSDSNLELIFRLLLLVHVSLRNPTH